MCTSFTLLSILLHALLLRHCATQSAPIDPDLCHISEYDFLNVTTTEFGEVSHLVGGTADVDGTASTAVRVIATQIEPPTQRKFVVARRVYQNMSPFEVIDALYSEFPRRRYLPCSNESYAELTREIRIVPRSEIIFITVKEVHRSVFIVMLVVLCTIVLIIGLLVERL